MAAPHDFGRRGEEIAVRHLEGAGWGILGRNFRDGPREIDVIAGRGDVIAFVEVKARRGDAWGHPFDAITWRKRREVVAAARAWIAANRPRPGTVFRFDAVSVALGPRGEPVVEHVQDAWRVGGP